MKNIEIDPSIQRCLMCCYFQVDDFLQALVNFDKEHIPEATVRCVRDEYLKDPEFNPDFVRLKSSAAAGLCSWVINIVRFHEVQPTHTQALINMCRHQHITLYILFQNISNKQYCVHVNYFPFLPLLPWTDVCKWTDL